MSSAAALAIIGIVHSVMGERRIFRQWAMAPPTDVRGFHRRILRATWHLPSLLGLGQSALLACLGAAPVAARPDPILQQMMLACLAVSVAASGVLVLWMTRGRHPGGTALVAAAVLMLIGIVRV